MGRSTKLRVLADDAQTDTPIIGYTEFMPIHRIDEFRKCKAGECPVGNLFTDAIRWYTKTDVGFTSSGGYRGLGWPEGPVKLTDLYASLPFPNTPCQGKENTKQKLFLDCKSVELPMLYLLDDLYCPYVTLIVPLCVCVCVCVCAIVRC